MKNFEKFMKKICVLLVVFGMLCTHNISLSVDMSSQQIGADKTENSYNPMESPVSYGELS